MRRSNNQDSLSALPASSQKRFATHGHLFLVADGMGAHAAGELASRMATEQVAMSYFRTGGGSIRHSLHGALTEANQEIHARGRSNPEFHQMGTTISALAITPEGGWIAHVGDSRVYRLRDDHLEQLTFDHSLAWEVAASGQSNLNVPRNVITRSLGPSEQVEIDLEGPFDLRPGDRFVLCSDGLTGPVDDVEVAVLTSCLKPQAAVNVLVDLANLRGGPDNISVIIVEVGTSEAESTTNAAGSSASAYPRSLIATTVICLVVSAALFFGGLSGPAVVALLLAIGVGVMSVVQTKRDASGTRRSGSAPPADVTVRGGAPYRRYDAKPNRVLYDKLGTTISELREAAGQRGWSLDWNEVDRRIESSDQLVRQGDLCAAIAKQSEAVIETMNQLRKQHDRAASETSAE